MPSSLLRAGRARRRRTQTMAKFLRSARSSRCLLATKGESLLLAFPRALRRARLKMTSLTGDWWMHVGGFEVERLGGNGERAQAGYHSRWLVMAWRPSWRVGRVRGALCG